ncbi:MAG: DNA methyltransferase [Verrucomicrobiales bacterium]
MTSPSGLAETPRPRRLGPDANKLEAGDRPAHDWYRFVLSFPPHLVRDYVRRFDLGPKSCVLDPFCGTGTTVVETKKLGLHGIGLEAHPMAHFASATKVDWTPDPDRLEKTAAEVAERALMA